MTTARARYRALILCAAIAGALPAGAALVTVSDPNSDFTVTYDDEQTGLFGTPFLSNNTVFFLPNDFSSASTNGEGQVLTNDTIQIRLDAITPGFSLDSFSLQERGDYLLDGPGASVSVLGEMRLFDVNTPFDEFSDTLTTGPLNINDGQLHDWVGTANIDQSSGWGGAQSVWLTLENLLIASTDSANSLAFVEKKFEGVQISVATVPVPSAVWMFGSAILLLMRRGA